MTARARAQRRFGFGVPIARRGELAVVDIEMVDFTG